MFKQEKLQSLIENKIAFRPISTGWMVGKCSVCGDYKERAGFKFDNDIIAYNCWNCGTATRYEEFSGRISKKMRNVLRTYGIDDSEINQIVNTSFFTEPQNKSVITLTSLTSAPILPAEIPFPKGSHRLGYSEKNLEYQEKLASYLVSRKIDLLKYPFYYSLEERFINRIIIPFFRNGKLIYWQARSILKTEKKRYDNAPVQRDNIMFNMDQLGIYSNKPLLVTEGVFDALIFDGLAILGSELNKSKIELLSKTKRDLIFVLDKDQKGKKLAKEVLRNGWKISFSPEGTSDINDSVQKYGKSWTALGIMKNIPKNLDEAQLLITLNCK